MFDRETCARREKLVLDHFHDEVVHEWDDVLSTFPHPRYEIIPLMKVHDGGDEVRGYYANSRIAFPDQDHEIIALRHAHDAVIVEFWLMGTHLGPFGPVPATGQKFRVRMTAYFIFDGDENLICERIYFDSLSIFKQLLGGLNMKNPKNWILVIKALRGFMKLSGEEAHPDILNTPKVSFPNYTHLPARDR